MKIAVFSDIHENIHNLTLAFRDMEGRGVEQGLFLGDFINNGVAKLVAAAPMPVSAVFGNNDGDRAALTRTSLAEGSRMTLSENIYDFVEFGGRNIFVTHYPDIARSMARSGDFDAVFYGHNHDRHEERIGRCLLANPGEISAHKTRSATYLIYDTDRHEVEFVELAGIVTVRTDVSDAFRENAGFVYDRKSGHRLHE